MHMLNDSYRAQSECWQKTSEFQKGKKTSRKLGRAKEKIFKKERKRNRDQTCASGRELWKRKSFCTLGRPLTGRDEGGGLWSLKEETGQSRENPTQMIGADQQSPAWDASLPTGAGGGWMLRLGIWRSDPREKTGVGCIKTAWGGLYATAEGVQEVALASQRRKGPLLQGVQGEGRAHHRSF